MNTDTKTTKTAKPPSLAALKRTARECAERAVCQAHVNPATLPWDAESLRAIYRKIQSDSPLSMRDFNVAARTHMPPDAPLRGATPRHWIQAALAVHTTCDKCNGTGVYRWGGAATPSTPNVPAHSGVCYACGGKGIQRHDDWVRNANYWNHFAHIGAT
jgi:hypothetical protein